MVNRWRSFNYWTLRNDTKNLLFVFYLCIAKWQLLELPGVSLSLCNLPLFHYTQVIIASAGFMITCANLLCTLLAPPLCRHSTLYLDSSLFTLPELYWKKYEKDGSCLCSFFFFIWTCTCGHHWSLPVAHLGLYDVLGFSFGQCNAKAILSRTNGPVCRLQCPGTGDNARVTIGTRWHPPCDNTSLFITLKRT